MTTENKVLIGVGLAVAAYFIFKPKSAVATPTEPTVKPTETSHCPQGYKRQVINCAVAPCPQGDCVLIQVEPKESGLDCNNIKAKITELEILVEGAENKRNELDYDKVDTTFVPRKKAEIAQLKKEQEQKGCLNLERNEWWKQLESYTKETCPQGKKWIQMNCIMAPCGGMCI